MSNLPVPSVFIFVALDCEAKALIAFFQLKKQLSHHPFALYANATMLLTVTGVGKVAMAGAVAYTLALYREAVMPLMLNVGVSGHKTQSLGQLLLASKVRDTTLGKAYYPQFMRCCEIGFSELSTVSQPCTQYGDDCLYDMEASAFYEMAMKFSSLELIQCLKVVSDNEHSGIEQIHAKQVTDWMQARVQGIAQVIDVLLQRRGVALPQLPVFMEEIAQCGRLSVSYQLKIHNLLSRWQVLTDGATFPHDLSRLSTAKERVDIIEAELAKQVIGL